MSILKTVTSSLMSQISGSHGLSRALSYIVQSLSGEPGFANKLLLPVRIQVPPKWVVTGTTADFMINVNPSLNLIGPKADCLF